MKKPLLIVSLILLTLSLILVFVPSFTFSVLGTAIEDAQSDVDKMADKVTKAQEKYDAAVADGDDADSIAKLKDKLDKAIANMEESEADYDTVVEKFNAPPIVSSLFTAGLPDELTLNKMILNENQNIYKEDVVFGQIGVLRYLVPSFIVLAILFLVFAMLWGKSHWLTLAAVLELLALLGAGALILMQRAIPIKAPFGNAVTQWPATVLVLLLLAGLCVKSLNSRGVKRTFVYFLCIFLCIMSLFPFYVMIINSTRDTYSIQQGMSLLPGSNLAYNWSKIDGLNFDPLLGMRNSAIIAFGSTILSVYFSSLCAYGLVTYQFKGKKFLFSFILAIMMIPSQVTVVGFFVYMYRIGWTNSFLPLILPGIAAPATVFFMRQYLLANFQVSLVEASRIDGAGEFRSFNKIVLPIMMPAMATMGIFSVIGSWNNYITPLMLLSDKSMATLPMMVRTLRGDIYKVEYGSLYLGLTLSALPLLVVYFSLSKFIIRGVALGGVKE